MAIIRNSPLVGPISGSLGAITFVQARGGQVVRTRPLKNNQRSPAQLDMRVIMDRLNNAWLALTDDQRAAWKAQAQVTSFRNRLGSASPPTAINLFRRTNLSILRITNDLIREVPVPYATADQDPVSIAFSSGGPFSVITGLPGGAPFYFFQVFASRSFRTTLPSIFRGRRTIFLGRNPTPTVNVFDGFCEHLGEPAVGEYVEITVQAADPPPIIPQKRVIRATIAP